MQGLRPEKVKDLLPMHQWGSRVSKPEFTFFVHAYTTEPRPTEGVKNKIITITF